MPYPIATPGDGAEKSRRERKRHYYRLTYYRPHQVEHRFYVGRTSGYGFSAEEVMQRRLAAHNISGYYGPDAGYTYSVMDRWLSATEIKDANARHTDEEYQAIRGREDLFIDYLGGPIKVNPKSTAANRIRGIRLNNPNREKYHSTATRYFGNSPSSYPVHP